jgi:murein DD-endopeptidase MepM/ murein hydrolase activator NlpD
MTAAPRPAIRYLVAAGLLGFVLGAFVVASLGNMSVAVARGPIARLTGAPVDEPSNAVVEVPAPTSGKTGVIPTTAPEAKDLASRHLTIPVEGVPADKLVRSYHDARNGGREHEALDILAPRNTPIVAVEDGTIAKLFLSKAGGITVYQFDPRKDYAYYYAHLDRYAFGVSEGKSITRGEVIGYVGSTGNADPSSPHLHFAIFILGPEKQWWKGDAIDPYPALTQH